MQLPGLAWVTQQQHTEPLESAMSNLVSTAGATKFRPGQRVVHPRFGRGRIVETYAVAQNPTEETEYRVKLIGDRYPATLAESNLTAL